MKLAGTVRAVAVVLVTAAVASGQDLVLERTGAALNRGDVGTLREALAALEQRDRQRQQEFAAATGRSLPPKARDRLHQAREAYQAGHGRLLAILRELTSHAAPGPSAALVIEAQELVARLEDSAHRQPISADLPVGAPVLQAPTLGLPSGATSAAPIGPVPPLLKDAADALPGVVDVYEWVRNMVAPEFYYGVMKGEVQTYLEQAGNDADTATVLVQMLRAKGVLARYVRGTVQLPATKLMELVGTSTADQAVRVLKRAGLPHEVILGAGRVAGVQMERVWAEAYVPYANYRGAILGAQDKVWVPLDAAFKALERPTGVDPSTLGFDARSAWEEYLGALQPATPMEFVRERVTGLLASRPGLTYDDVLNRRSVTSAVYGLLPNRLPYQVVSVTEVSYDLPETLTHMIRLVAERDGSPLLDTKLTVREVLGRRLTLSYEPASDEDADVIASYGALALTPPYLVEVSPVVRSGGVPSAKGTAIGMGVAFTLRLELATPGGTQTVTNTLLAGNTTAIGLGGRAVKAPEEGIGTAAEILSGIARSYLQSWNDSDAELAALMKVVPLRPTVSLCLVSSAVDVEYAGGDPLYPIRYEWRGVLIDADVRATAPVGLVSREAEGPFLLLSGLEGSILENRVFETRHQIPSVSTAKTLGLAASEGFEIHDLTPANVEDVLPGLPFDLTVKAEVRDAVARGFMVKIPALPVSHLAWRGVGYVVLDEETSEAAYQLQGGHSGGITAPSTINWPVDLRDALIFKDGQPPQGEARGVARLQKLQSTDFQIGTVNKALQRPLRVLVTDSAGYALPMALVTFTVIGGGSDLHDPIGGGRGVEVSVRSDNDGIAGVTLTLGKRTDVIPRFLLPQSGEEYATQVGLSMVTARAELARLDEPFFALSLPDDQLDASGHSYGYLTLRGGTDAGWSANLRVAARLSIGVSDPYGNPLSNAPIRLAYDAPARPATRAGYVPVRPPNDSPAGALSPRDYERCAQQASVVLKDQCPGEAPTITVKSSALGAFAYPVLGGSPFSHYYFDVGTPLTPKVAWVAYSTTGPACYGAPSDCADISNRPEGWATAGSRSVLVNTLGDLVEAYAPGASASAGFWSDVVYEREQIVNYRDNTSNTDRFVAEGTNIWVRERLDDTRFRLAPITPGTSVSPVAAAIGNGLYIAALTTGPTPMLNTIGWEAELHPKLIPYLPAAAATLPGQVDPSLIDNSDPRHPKLIERIRSDRSWSSRGTFSVWGILASANTVHPASIFLSDRETTAHHSIVSWSIMPVAFAELLVPSQVLFELKGSAGPVLAASGNGRSAVGTFLIPSDLPLIAGHYTAIMSILGVVGPTGGSLLAPPAPIRAGVVKLTLDANNDALLDARDDDAYRADPGSRFAFWEATDNPAQPSDVLQDYASVRIHLPFEIGADESLALTMGSSRWALRTKAGTGNAYLSNEAAAAEQLRTLADLAGHPVAVGRGRWEIPRELLNAGTNEFLFRCDPPSEGERSCPDTTMRLERILGPVATTVAERPILIKPVRDWMSAYTARGGPTAYEPRTRLMRMPGWAEVPIDARRVTIFVHGFNVDEAGAADRWFPAMFRRLYWVGHPLLRSQDKAHLIGITWPGDQKGDLIPTPAAFYPENEFNALRSGVAVGQLLYELRAPQEGRSVNILAHSLGNMVVHSAVMQLERDASDAPMTYVMYEAAVAAEAFDYEYVHSDVDVVSTLPQVAAHYGASSDARWDAEWHEMFAERDDCAPDPSPCGVSDYYIWRRAVEELDGRLSPAVSYNLRWRQRRPDGRGSWRGFFAGNLAYSGVRIYNAFSRTDHVLRVDRGRGDLVVPHAWFACQKFQKPNAGLGTALVDYVIGIPPGTKDGRRQQLWGALGGVSSAAELSRQEYLWGAVGDHSALVRQWAELAHWFPATSGPAGSQFVPRFGPRNIDLTTIGGEDPETSHSFIRANPFANVWEAFVQFRNAFAE